MYRQVGEKTAERARRPVFRGCHPLVEQCDAGYLSTRPYSDRNPRILTLPRAVTVLRVPSGNRFERVTHGEHARARGLKLVNLMREQIVHIPARTGRHRRVVRRRCKNANEELACIDIPAGLVHRLSLPAWTGTRSTS